MKIKLLGKIWQLRFIYIKKTKEEKAAHGSCDAPHIKGKSIRINNKLKGKPMLETLIHEMMHAADWTKDEEFVTEEARDITNVLWRLGYRRIGRDVKVP